MLPKLTVAIPLVKYKLIKNQEIVKAQTELKILQELTKARRLRWKDLKERTGLSSRTLSDRLKELQGKGLVRRIIDNSTYPPAVYYEAASKAHLIKFPIGKQLMVIERMMKEWRELRETLHAMLFSSENPEKTARLIVEYTLEDYVFDLLFTLKYCFENTDVAPILIAYHTQLYEARLLALMDAWRKNPTILNIINKAWIELKEERKREIENILKNFVAPFKDKPLAKAILKLYAVKRSLYGYKEPITRFVKEIPKNKTMKEELEKIFKAPIDKERLEAVIKEQAWETLKLT